MTTLRRVGDVLQLQRRAVEVDPSQAYEEIGVRSFGKGIFHKDPVSGVELGNKRVFRIQPDDLVLSNVFAWEGAVAVAGLRESGKVGSHRFMTFTPIDNEIDTTWAAWFFRSEPGLELIGRASPGSAGRNRTLAIDRFENLAIPLPPIDEQRATAAVLNRLALAKESIDALAERTQLISGALTVSTCARFDLSADDKARSGWRNVRLGTVLTLAQHAEPVDAGLKYRNLGIYSFGRGLFLKPDIDGATTSAKALYRVRHGQFIYSRLFAFEGAYAAVSDAFDGYYVSNEFPMFDPDPAELDARWLAAYLSTPTTWSELAGASKGLGVRRQRVPVEAILNFTVSLPPIEQQQTMVNELEQLQKASAARLQMRHRVESLIPAALNAEFARFD